MLKLMFVVVRWRPEGKSPTDFDALVFRPAVAPATLRRGPMGLVSGCVPTFRAEILEDCEVVDPVLQLTTTAPASSDAGGRAPIVQLGTSAVALGSPPPNPPFFFVMPAAVAVTAVHSISLVSSMLCQTPERKPADASRQLATMQIDTDGLAARIDDLVYILKRPREPRGCACLRARRRRLISLSPAPRRGCRVRSTAFSKGIWPSSDCSATLMQRCDWPRRAMFLREFLGNPFGKCAVSYAFRSHISPPDRIAIGRKFDYLGLDYSV